MMIIIWMWWIKGLVGGRIGSDVTEPGAKRLQNDYPIVRNLLFAQSHREHHLNVCTEHNLNLHHSPPLARRYKSRERGERKQKIN